MIKEDYKIAFSLPLDNNSLMIALTAEVQLHHSEPYYLIRNIRTARQPRRLVLADFEIRKMKGQWVHSDSEKETDLSVATGQAIDVHEKENQ